MADVKARSYKTQIESKHQNADNVEQTFSVLVVGIISSATEEHFLHSPDMSCGGIVPCFQRWHHSLFIGMYLSNELFQTSCSPCFLSSGESC